MAEVADGIEPPLTEPKLLPCLFVTGAAVEVLEGVVRLIAWMHTPDLGGETEERRIVARLTLSVSAARKLEKDLKAIRSRPVH